VPLSGKTFTKDERWGGNHRQCGKAEKRFGYICSLESDAMFVPAMVRSYIESVANTDTHHTVEGASTRLIQEIQEKQCNN
jgi:hypothetical protein